LARAVQRAREVASRMGTAGPSAVHLLLALIHDRKNGAHRALEQCGVDVSRLRAAAMQLALGRVGPRRSPQQDVAVGQAVGVRVPITPRPASTGSTMSTMPQPNAHPSAFSPPPSAPPASKSTPPPAPSATPVLTMPLAPARTPKKRARHAPSSDSPFALDPKHYPVLASIGRNLTQAAAEGSLEPVVGRSTEIDQALDILAKRHANNPLLLGPAGVGKTAVVHGLAQRIAARDDVCTLDDRIIIEIPISELVAGTNVRGSLAERVQAIRNEAREAMGRVVVFFDEIHTLFAGEMADEIQGDLKIALSRGELPCIGATTPEEYKRTIEVDAALARRFSMVEVVEPEEAVAREILAGCAPALAKHHGVHYADDVYASTVAWSIRYLPGRALPDKALSVLDLAGARARRRSARVVTSQGIAEVVAELADMPIERLLETDGERMLALESLLGERVVGHHSALARMANILRRNAAGFRARRPIGTFLLLGPTGVGKTESAKAIAHALFHSENAMTRVDMAEYAESHAIARLIGAPPGYVGHDAGGQLTEAVRRRPYQVLLLDEIEKAHRDVLEAFLGVFDEGRLTDGRGKTVDFTNTVIILTSNLGARDVSAKAIRTIGFGSTSVEQRVMQIEEALVGAARSALPPELYNRIDEVIAFAPLQRIEVAEIARRLLAGLSKTLDQARGVLLDVEDEAIDALLDAGGFDPELGARPMKRTIARLVEAPIADMILRGEVGRGDVARLTVENGEIVVDVVRGHRVRSSCPAPSADHGNFGVRTA
ncbi:MAG TPA: ATP-dependent Clp protease ATP-binding subunit, partial [Polyangiaceae bacterium]|nr:ATP-dependent Clp protease ATP-binding subunit [Polyangiaceae bacterium]